MYLPLDMHSVTAGVFIDDISHFLTRAALNQTPIHVLSAIGDAVLISGQAYDNLTETLLLLDIPGMLEHLLDGCSTPIEECEDFAW